MKQSTPHGSINRSILGMGDDWSSEYVPELTAIDAQANSLKAIAYKIDEISKKLDK